MKPLYRIAATALVIMGVFTPAAYSQAAKPASDVTRSERIEDVSDLLKAATKDTLVVFDIDDTLLTSESFFGSDYWYEWQKTLKKGDTGFVPCKLREW